MPCPARLNGEVSAVRSVLECFYSTPRVGAFRLSDGGGPFGFDIAVAYQVDWLVGTFAPDIIVETGCFVGDTTEYLARCYPEIPVVGVEVNAAYAAIAERRLDRYANVSIWRGDSGVVLARVLEDAQRPFVILDAHWEEAWPLRAELAAIEHGVVAVDDFDIGDPRFGFDEYDGVALNGSLLRELRPDVNWYAGDPHAEYPTPCLQIGRRTGVAYALVGHPVGDVEATLDHEYFVRVSARVANCDGRSSDERH